MAPDPRDPGDPLGEGPLGEGVLGPEPEEAAEVTEGWRVQSPPAYQRTRRPFYPSLIAVAGPIPILTLVATAFSISAATPAARPLYYQSNVYCPTPLAVAAPDNTGTLSSWHVPFRSAAGLTTRRTWHTQPIYSYTAPAAAPVTITMEWQQPFQPEVRLRPVRHTQPTYSYLAPVDDGTLLSWYAPFHGAVGLRPVRHTQPVYGADIPAVDNTGTLSSWHRPLSSAASLTARRTWHTQPVYAYTPITPDNTGTLSSWHVPFQASAKLSARPVRHTQPTYGDAVLVTDTTGTPLSWYAPFRGAVGLARRAWPTQPTYDYIEPAPVTVTMEWQQRFQAATKRRWPAKSAAGVWLSQPIVFVENTGTLPSWYMPFRGAASLTARQVWHTQPIYNYLALPPETVFPAAATSAISAQSPRRTLFYQSKVYAPTPLVVTADTGQAVDKWLMQWRGPPRIRAAKTQVIYPARFVATQTTDTPDRWLMRWQGPPKIRPRSDQQRLVFSVIGVFSHFDQQVSATITTSMDLHECGFGTASEASDAFSTESEQSTGWVVQTEEEDDFDEQDPACGST